MTTKFIVCRSCVAYGPFDTPNDADHWAAKNLPDDMRNGYLRVLPLLPPNPNEYQQPANGRTSLDEHKERLIAFLSGRQTLASRKEILTGTGMPQGTLSAVLRDEKFYRGKRGLWGLNP